VAIDVPFHVDIPPPGTEEVMEDPGASRSKKSATLEKLETVSPSVVEPTLTADEMQAGVEMVSLLPEFPLATTVAIPTERKVSIAAFREDSFESHSTGSA
jgi:hypothetical protein